VTTEVMDVVVLLSATSRRRRVGLVADGFIDCCRRAAGIRAEMIGILAAEEIAHVRSSRNVVTMEFLVRRINDRRNSHGRGRRRRQ